jgi:hypothetical protein
MMNNRTERGSRLVKWIVILQIVVILVYVHFDGSRDSLNNQTRSRKLTLQESIHEGLQFLRLESLPQLKANLSNLNKEEASPAIAFLESEKHPDQKPSLLSQAISFLDLAAITAKEKLHLESLSLKKARKDISEAVTGSMPPPKSKEATDHSIHFLDTHTVEKQTPGKVQKMISLPAKEKDKEEKDQNIHFLSGKKKSPNKSSLSNVKIDTRLDSAEQEMSLAHPQISPRLGTNINLENQINLMNCLNQSRCLVPELQLQKKYKIYFCKHPVRYGVRFYYLAREGLLLHPNVQLLDHKDINKADYIVYLPGSAPWHKTECNQTSYASRLIVLDEFDGHTLFLPTRTKEEYATKYGSPQASWYALYFKRSFVRRADGKFLGYPHLPQYQNYPMVYAIAEAYIPHTFRQTRETDVLCTLRGSAAMSTRLRVQHWIAEYGKERNIQKVVSGQVDNAQRTTISRKYFENMYDSRIIVTVNPAHWEGDFRLWESFVSGALIFVDPLFVPHPYPLTDKEHVVYFSNNNRTDLFMKLDYYRNHPDEARRIAMNGYFHAMKYHRTVNLMDYILRTAHMKEALDKQKGGADHQHDEDLPDYTYTGQYLNFMAKAQEKMIKHCHTPGVYEPYPKIPKDINAVHHLTHCN